MTLAELDMLERTPECFHIIKASYDRRCRKRRVAKRQFAKHCKAVVYNRKRLLGLAQNWRWGGVLMNRDGIVYHVVAGMHHWRKRALLTKGVSKP